jgi:energy-coupling factor transport system permease protein
VSDIATRPGPVRPVIESVGVSATASLHRRSPGLGLAPGTVVVAVVVINIVALSTINLSAALIAAGLVVAAVATLRRPRVLLGAGTGMGISLALFLIPLPGALSLLNPVGFWTFRFSVAILAGLYLLLAVQPGELAATLYQVRAPRWLATPLVVMMRFFPQVRQEFRAVFEAMSLRGIPVGPTAWLLHPLRTIEYLLVPLLVSSSRIADDLASSVLVRGLGQGARPTALNPIRFTWRDAIAAVVLAALAAAGITGWSVL